MKTMLMSVRNCLNVFQNGWTIVHPHQQYMGLLTEGHPCQCLIWEDLGVIVLMGVCGIHCCFNFPNDK
jgi:hypothetical protein